MEIFGNQCSQRLARAALSRGRIPRSLVLTGPDYVGKRSFALGLLEELSPDGHVVAGPGVDGVREAKDFLSSRPVFGAFRAVLADEADRLSESAQDAYLKLCEDSPSTSVVVFITSDVDAVLPPLRSRFDVITRWSPLEDSEMEAGFPAYGPSARDMCLGRPGLLQSVSRPEMDELRRAISDVISGSVDPFLLEVPGAISGLKGSRSPDRDAVASICRFAARGAGARAPAFLRFAAVLESVPSANAEIHWQRACLCQ